MAKRIYLPTSANRHFAAAGYAFANEKRELNIVFGKGNGMKLPPQMAPALWGAAGGAALLAILGFSWFGWVTGGSAERTAQERANAAVVAALTPVCVERFKESANATQNLEALAKIEYFWERGTFIEKGGWATFPNSAAPNSEVARACAEALKQA
jgi:hypothetical protein